MSYVYDFSELLSEMESLNEKVDELSITIGNFYELQRALLTALILFAVASIAIRVLWHD